MTGYKVKSSSLIALLLLPLLAWATAYDGTWSNSLVFEKNRIDTSRPAIGFNENILFAAKKIQGTDASLFTDFNYNRDFASPGLKNFDITNLYLDWNNFRKAFDLRAGRQLSFAGNTPVYLDGIWLRRNINQKILFTAVGGNKVPSPSSNVFFERHVDKSIFDLTLRSDYKLANGSAGILYQNDIKYFKTLDQNAGVFFSNDFSDKLYGRANIVFDILGTKVRTFQLTSSYQVSDKVAFDAEVSKEEWKIDSSSIFSQKVFQAYKEGSVNGYYTMAEGHTAMAGYLVRRFDKNQEIAHEMVARLTCNPLSVGFRQDLGYGGDATEVNAGARLLQTAYVGVNLNGSMIRYTFSEQDTSARYSWMGALLLDIGHHPSMWDIKLESQVLRNRYYQYDMRMYLSSTIYFSRFSK